MNRNPNSQSGRRIPKPSYRHATPAGPWPYIDHLDDQESEETLEANARTRSPTVIGSCGHDNCEDCKEWIAYPQSLFGNWTIKPVRKCGIEWAVKNNECPSTIYTINVCDDGKFNNSAEICVTSGTKREFWNGMLFKEPERGIRVRALFVDNMSGPVLQMLGTRYRIEPFFYSSSINWLPSRYQEHSIPKTGDHITVTLTFIRVMAVDQGKINLISESTPVDRPTGLLSRFRSTLSSFSSWTQLTTQFKEIGKIDPLAPMYLHSSQKVVYPDFLGVHMVRDVKGSTIISYHHDIDGATTSAKALFSRMKLVGRSVYWQLLVENSKDPTFVFLAVLWSALYAWDQAFEELYAHFLWLESRVINTNDMVVTYELHVMRAHLLHYTSLLRDFRKSVEFVRDTANPAMDSDNIDDATRLSDKKVLKKECENLLAEIHRMEAYRKMLDNRVQNVQTLVFTNVDIDDTRAMKRLSYISMIFLPATFTAHAFGMNATELNPMGHFTLARFFEACIPLTLVIICVILALQNRLKTR